MLSGATVPDILLGNNLLHSPDSYQGVLLGILFGALPQTPWPLCLFEVLWPLKLLPPDLTFPKPFGSKTFSFGKLWSERGGECSLPYVKGFLFLQYFIECSQL